MDKISCFFAFLVAGSRFAAFGFVLTLSALAPCQSQANEALRSFELWLKLGQSNAVGACHLKPSGSQSGLDIAGLDAPHPNVHEVNRNLPTPPWNPIPPGPTHLQRARSWDSFPAFFPNPESDIGFHQMFGKVRATLHPEIRILAIYNGAKGATAMLDQWLPGRPLFETAVRDAQAFLQQNPACHFKGILWHQGESDALALRTQGQYEADLSYMVREMRRRIPGGDTSVFIAGTMSHQWRVDNQPNQATPAQKDAIHQAHLRIPAYIPRSTIVNCDDLIETHDIIHFKREHLRVMGTRYAQAAEILLAAGVAHTPPSYQFKYDAATMEFQNVAGSSGAILAQTLTAGIDPVLTTVPVGGPASATGFASTIQLQSQHYTKALWVKCARPPESITSFLSIGTNGSASLMLAHCVGHGFYADCLGNTTFLDPTNYPDNVSPLALDRWVHLCVTYSGLEFRVYVNGVPIQMRVGNAWVQKPPYTAQAVALPATTGLDIGRWTHHQPTQFVGQMDNIVVLPYAAHPLEIPVLMR